LTNTLNDILGFMAKNILLLISKLKHQNNFLRSKSVTNKIYIPLLK